MVDPSNKEKIDFSRVVDNGRAGVIFPVWTLGRSGAGSTAASCASLGVDCRAAVRPIVACGRVGRGLDRVVVPA